MQYMHPCLGGVKSIILHYFVLISVLQYLSYQKNLLSWLDRWSPQEKQGVGTSGRPARSSSLAKKSIAESSNMNIVFPVIEDTL